VLADGRISMRVRPEVSELSNEGSIRLNGFDVPALTTRRAETTVELGSGQSFMIAGLLRNSEQQQHRQGAVPRRPADPRRAVPLDRASAATRPSW
jgi:Flp pilus assembly secretin CpaC